MPPAVPSLQYGQQAPLALQVASLGSDRPQWVIPSHFHAHIVPILVATKAPAAKKTVEWSPDQVALTAKANEGNLPQILRQYEAHRFDAIDTDSWLQSRYKPTPTIIEAAKALYEGHSVENISWSDAGAINLSRTARAITAAIDHPKKPSRKTVCFVTGVPGSGKTLAGLNLATSRMRVNEEEHAVFLSGNGPLVTVLREALVRDEVARSKAQGVPLTKKAGRHRCSGPDWAKQETETESYQSTAGPLL